MPRGPLGSAPFPYPPLFRASVKFCTAKVAVTVVAALSVTVQVPVPEQLPPLQPVKVEPAAGAAVKVSAVPLAKDAGQSGPHEKTPRPPGARPGPAPARPPAR